MEYQVLSDSPLTVSEVKSTITFWTVTHQEIHNFLKETSTFLAFQTLTRWLLTLYLLFSFIQSVATLLQQLTKMNFYL